jgi:Domain of unknown function (DUF4349)
VKAILVVFTVICVSVLGCGGDSDSALPGDFREAAPDAATATSNLAAVQEKLVIDSRLELEVQGLREAFESVARSVRDEGGFVADSRIEDQVARATAFLRLRLPASRHEDFLGSLRGVSNSKVLNEETTAQEATTEFTDLQSRLVNLERTEAQYRELLARSGTVDEVLKVTQRLDEVRSELEQVKGRLRLLEDRIDFATVSVTLSLPPLARAGVPSPLKVLVQSFEVSLVVAQAVANAAMVLLVVSLWLVPTSFIVLLVRRPLRRQWDAIRARIS